VIDLPEDGDHNCNESAAQQPTAVNCGGSGVRAASQCHVILHCEGRLKANIDKFDKLSFLYKAEQIDWLVTRGRPVCAGQCPDRFG
jgi:hypothetical protein